MRLAWDQVPHWGKRRKKIGVGEKKKIGERSEPRGSLERGKGGGRPFPPQLTARLASLADIFPI